MERRKLVKAKFKKLEDAAGHGHGEPDLESNAFVAISLRKGREKYHVCVTVRRKGLAPSRDHSHCHETRRFTINVVLASTGSIEHFTKSNKFMKEARFVYMAYEERRI